MIAEQEKAIRKDPVGAATGMAQKVFGLSSFQYKNEPERGGFRV